MAVGRARIWALVGQIEKAARLDREATVADYLRPAARQASGQESTAALTADQEAAVAAKLERRLKTLLPADPRQHAKISPAMSRTLKGLFALAEMDTEERQRGFSVRQCGKPWPQTLQDADKILEGLEAIVLRAHPAAAIIPRIAAAIAKNTPVILDAWKTTWLKDVADRYAKDPRRTHSAGRIAKLVEIEQALERAAR